MRRHEKAEQCGWEGVLYGILFGWALFCLGAASVLIPFLRLFICPVFILAALGSPVYWAFFMYKGKCPNCKTTLQMSDATTCRKCRLRVWREDTRFVADTGE